MPLASERPKLLLLGDSLTQTCFEGWGAGLADRYQRRADIINRGMSGYNTRWYLRYASDNDVWNEPGTIVLVTIFFGANDAALIDQDPAKHVPIPEYKDNLKAIVEKAQESYPQANILLITPPPVHKGQRLAYQKQRYGDKATGIAERTSEHTEKYANTCIEVAKETNVPCLDMFSVMKEAGGEDDGFGKFLSDGLHFSSEGHDFVLKVLLEAIETHYPALAVIPDPVTGQSNNISSKCEALENSGPYHDEIKHNEWEKAFEGRKRKEPSS
jgi:lysophospholipase L1-like esterase